MHPEFWDFDCKQMFLRKEGGLDSFHASVAKWRFNQRILHRDKLCAGLMEIWTTSSAIMVFFSNHDFILYIYTFTSTKSIANNDHLIVCFFLEMHAVFQGPTLPFAGMHVKLSAIWTWTRTAKSVGTCGSIVE